MKIYNYKYHAALSLITSGIIGVISFFIIKPTTFPSVTGEIISKDTGQSVIQHTTYGYSSVAIIVIISLLIMLVLYKPIKKAMDKRIDNTN